MKLAIEGASLQRFEYSQPHMGTIFKIIYMPKTPKGANGASDAAFERVAEP